MSGLLNAEQAAEYLGGIPVTAETVKKLARTKKLRHVRINTRTVAFPIDALDEYIADHTVAVEENPWGLTDSALRSVRDGRASRTSRAS